jgi:hypothetical protein
MATIPPKYRMTQTLKARFLTVIDFVSARLAEPTTYVALATVAIALVTEAVRFDTAYTIVAAIAGLVAVAVHPEAQS